jgi:hypothetical protein
LSELRVVLAIDLPARADRASEQLGGVSGAGAEIGDGHAGTDTHEREELIGVPRQMSVLRSAAVRSEDARIAWMASAPSGAGAGKRRWCGRRRGCCGEPDAALAGAAPHADAASKEARKREGAIRMARTFTRLEACAKGAVPRAGRPKLEALWNGHERR